MNENKITLNTQKSEIELLKKKKINDEKLNSIITSINNILSYKNTVNGFFTEMVEVLRRLDVSQKDFFSECMTHLAKAGKTKTDITIVSGYLLLMKDFTNLISGKEETNLSSILTTVSNYLTFEKSRKNKVLMRFGDIGKKAYIILDGGIDILIKTPTNVKIYPNDYLKYIVTLIKFKEYGLLNLVLNENYKVYRLEIENDIKIKSNPFEINSKNLMFRDVKKLVKYKASQLLKEQKVDVEEEEIDDVITQEYIDRLKVWKDLSTHLDTVELETNPNIINVTVYSYFKVISRSNGALFGEIALNDPLALRTASIITSGDSYFGTLNKASYDVSVKESATKKLTKSLFFIRSFSIFKEINMKLLYKKYFNNFSLKSVNHGEKILNQNKKSNSLYLLREGEFVVTIKASLSDLTKLIIYYCSKIKKTNILSSIKKSEYTINLKMRENKKLRSEYNEKRDFTITELGTSVLVGFDDFINDLGETMYTVECKSLKGEMYELSKIFYEDMKKQEDSIRENEKKFFHEKSAIFIDRLMCIRDSILKTFSDLKENEIIEKKEEILFRNRLKSKVTIIKTNPKRGNNSGLSNDINTTIGLSKLDKYPIKITNVSEIDDSFFKNYTQRNSPSHRNNIPYTNRTYNNNKLSQESSPIKLPEIKSKNSIIRKDSFKSKEAKKKQKLKKFIVNIEVERDKIYKRLRILNKFYNPFKKKIIKLKGGKIPLIDNYFSHNKGEKYLNKNIDNSDTPMIKEI